MRATLNGPNGEWIVRLSKTCKYVPYCYSLLMCKEIMTLLNSTVSKLVIETTIAANSSAIEPKSKLPLSQPSHTIRLLVFNQDMSPFAYSLAELYRIRPLLLQFQPLATWQGLVKPPMWKMVVLDALKFPVRLEFAWAKTLWRLLATMNRMQLTM